MSGSLRNWIKVRFITGFFVTVPAVATAWLLYVFWDAIDTFFSPGYQRMFGRRIPGLGFLTAVVLVLVMGTIATNVVAERKGPRVGLLLSPGAAKTLYGSDPSPAIGFLVQPDHLAEVDPLTEDEVLSAVRGLLERGVRLALESGRPGN